MKRIFWVLAVMALSLATMAGADDFTGYTATPSASAVTTGAAPLDQLGTSTNTIGNIGKINSALPAGGNTIGSVTVITLPSTPAGTNTIGSVAVTVLPTLPAGTNLLGSVKMAPSTVGGTSTKAVSATSSAITRVTGATELRLYNIGTETVWVNIGGVGATVSADIPLLTNTEKDFPMDGVATASVVSSTPATIVTFQPSRP